MKTFSFLVCLAVLSIYETFGYDKTYPLTKPVKKGNTWKYRIAVISDNDKKSKVGENKWRSKLKKGWVTVQKKRNKMNVKKIKWDKKVLNIESSTNTKGRAMEMSELVVFNGKLYTCDEQTGIVYELIKDHSKLKQFARLKDGDGKGSEDFMCKWMTVKNNMLYVGSHGRESVDDEGKIVNKNNFWIKTLDTKGNVHSYNWFDDYNPVRIAAGYAFPGYLTVEAENWSDKHKKWFILPRKGSKHAYDDVKDKRRGVNELIIADDLSDEDSRHFIVIRNVGPLQRHRGFTSFKFIPDSGDEVFLALKVLEKGDKFSTFIGAYDINGKVVMKPKKIGKNKFEGLEFI